MLAYYGSTVCALLGLRYLLVRTTVLGSKLGLISAQRIFIFGTGKDIEEFVTRHQPRSLGVKVDRNAY